MVPFSRSLILDMLSYARPSGSFTERAFIRRFIEPLPGAWCDAGHNWHVVVGVNPTVLWSAHTDTVHHVGQRQTVSPTNGVVTLSRRAKLHGAQCLGADDSAGCALLVSMIRAGVPGHYVFHHAEEIGGIGSTWLAAHDPTTLGSVTCAIAFDRKGVDSVITHQGGLRCCSDVFARSLAAQLNVRGLRYVPDDGGTFTDTANYTDLIGECTNLSVGYAHAHTRRESLDVLHLETLYVALCAVDPAALTLARVPGEIDPEDFRWSWTQINPSVRTYAPLAATPALYPRLATAYPVDYECEHCEWCYDPYTSTAADASRYCSEDCERIAAMDSSCYLDRVYGDVQAALRNKGKLQ